MTDVHVAGDDLPSLAAALDLAEVGIRVRVELRGQALPHDARLDHEARLDHDGTLSALMRRLAEPIVEGGHRNDEVSDEAVPPRGLLLRGSSAEWLPAPEPSVQGVPVAPLARECLALLGSGRAMRAYLDRVKPLLTIGKTREFGPLVRARLGETAERVLVEPLIRERFGRPADDVEAAVVAPGLNEALSRTGNLTGAALAYLERNVARETGVRPRGGWGALRAALVERLSHYGAEFVERPAEIRFAEGRWLVEVDGDVSEVAAVVVGAGSRVGEEPDVFPDELHGSPGEGAGSPDQGLRATTRLHVHLEAAAGAPDWPSAEQLAERDALGLLHLDGETWTVRASVSPTTADGRRRFAITGPAVQRPLDAHETERLVGRLSAALGLGDTASPEQRPAAEWRAAPFAARDEREAARERLAALRRERETLVPVGARLHGGDLSAAVRSAHEEAVVLRRLLLGLSE